MHRAALRVTVFAALMALPSALPAVGAADPSLPPDICLSVGLAEADAVTTSAIADSVDEALAARPVLIPAPLVSSAVSEAESHGGVVRVLVWTEPTDEIRGPEWSETIAELCGVDPGSGSWSASISGEFLRAGTKRELAAAPTTPGFSSSIDVEWDEGTDTVRTVLRFSGPLDIPNGTCWMDDVLSTDGDGGTRVETTTGSRTSPFGDGVCGRFEEYLSEGGAGAQAIVLLPRAFALPAGDVRLLVDGVDVRDDGVHLRGSVEQDEMP